MKQFILKLFFFALVLFLIDKVFIVIRKLAPEYDHDRRLEYVLDGKINKDLIVFGSSRADTDISTWLFEEEFGLDSYNMSYGGSEIELQVFVLKQLLNNNKKPKMIIKIVDDDFELRYSANNVFRVDRLFPLVKYKEIRKELIKRGEKNIIMSNFFIMHQLSLSNFDFRAPEKINDTIIEFGNITRLKEVRNDFEWTYGTKNTYNVSEEIESKLNSFIEFQELCISNDIKLILTIPPSYQKLNTQFVKRIKKLMLYSVELHIYDETKPEYTLKKYFNDLIHLNKNGAEIYTKDLISFMKSIKNQG